MNGDVGLVLLFPFVSESFISDLYKILRDAELILAANAHKKPTRLNVDEAP